MEITTIFILSPLQKKFHSLTFNESNNSFIFIKMINFSFFIEEKFN